jgi:hypothetical protein
VGYQSHPSTRGNCTYQLSPADDDFSAYLDCWGGKIAAATYSFKIAATATNIRWAASTARSTDDICCRGTITKRGHRVSKTTFQVRVQVTGWRATIVRNARISYRARVRI